MARGLYNALFNDNQQSIGIFGLQGLFTMNEHYPDMEDHVKFYVLFGDPVTQLHYRGDDEFVQYAGYQGTVKINEKNPPPATQLYAFINDQSVASFSALGINGEFGPLYIPQDNPGSLEKEGGVVGDTVFFKAIRPGIDTLQLDPIAFWIPDEMQTLNLVHLPSAVENQIPTIQFYIDEMLVGDDFYEGDPIPSNSIVHAVIYSRTEVVSEYQVNCLLNHRKLLNDEILLATNQTDQVYQTRISYKPNRLEDGTYEFRVNLDGNDSSLQTEKSFRFTLQSRLSFSKVVNYPNPFARDTKFTFILFNEKSADITVKIYTIAGRLIRTLSDRFADVGYNEIYWDGTDAHGDPLANGVYFYKLIASDNQEQVEIIERLVVMH